MARPFTYPMIGPRRLRSPYQGWRPSSNGSPHRQKRFCQLCTDRRGCFSGRSAGQEATRIGQIRITRWLCSERASGSDLLRSPRAPISGNARDRGTAQPVGQRRPVYGQRSSPVWWRNGV